MAAIIAAIAAVLQAIFAGLVFWFIIKQTGISKKQAEVMERQTELSQKIDESAKAMRMWAEFADLSDTRKAFWGALGQLYSGFQRGVSSQGSEFSSDIHGLINTTTFPPDLVPDEVPDLRSFVENRMDGWRENVPIWQFMAFIHHLPQLLEDKGPLAVRGDVKVVIDEPQRKLSYFWERWSGDIPDRFNPSRGELLMLTWLELALVLRTPSAEGPGKTGLFNLAKKECARYRS